jgi:hypothetical protein
MITSIILEASYKESASSLRSGPAALRTARKRPAGIKWNVFISLFPLVDQAVALMLVRHVISAFVSIVDFRS